MIKMRPVRRARERVGSGTNVYQNCRTYSFARGVRLLSAYEPPDPDDGDDGVDPAEKGKDVVERREFTQRISDLDRVDYVKLAVLLSLPSSLVAVVLVVEFVPGLQDAAGQLLRGIADAVIGWLGPLAGYSSSATLGCIVGSPGCGSAKASRIRSREASSRRRRSASSISSHPGGTSRSRPVK